jgi:Cd2+/Zn2+-exporting ATPase
MSDECCKNRCKCGVSNTPSEPLIEPKQRVGIGTGISSRYLITDMDCPTEEAMIRSAFKNRTGILGLDFNLLERLLTVHHQVGVETEIVSLLQGIGFEPYPVEEGSASLTGSNEVKESVIPLRLSVGGVAALCAELLEWSAADVVAVHYVVPLLALVAICSAGLETFRKGWLALVHRQLNMNVLMAVAVTGAALIGQWPEAAMVSFLFAVANVIEQHSLDRARRAIQGLMQFAPVEADVKDAAGEWHVRDVGSVSPGEIIRVKAGERVPLDGDVCAGCGTVNQAPITGESLPVDKACGDRVFAGSINQNGVFEFRVTAAAGDTTLAHIIQTVEAAQADRAPVQRFVDRFAAIYTPLVFVAALGIAATAPFLFGWSWYEAVYRALVLLVIACPCALVISTPVTIVSGLAAATRTGILIKGGSYLENAGNIKAMAFDKTGTITVGAPTLTDVVFLRGDEHLSLEYAFTLASGSDHPVSRAIARGCRQRITGIVSLPVEQLTAIPGHGMAGVITDTDFVLANHRLIEDRNQCSVSLEERLESLERVGKTCVILADAEGVRAVFAVADAIKEESVAALAALSALGIHLVMVTGDNPHTAQAVAEQVGIDDVRANLLPQEKLQIIEELRATYGVVAMVGDGINDAPALARADIGIAMGSAGSDTAIETADVALMDDDPLRLCTLINLSRRTMTILHQNIFLALAIKAVFLCLALAGSATLWMAVFADMGASLIVVANGLRMLRIDTPRRLDSL